MRRTRATLTLCAWLLVVMTPTAWPTAVAQETPIVIGFHHVHMNVVNPERSASFYVSHVHSARVTVAGWVGVQTEDIYILFNKVEQSASNEWDSAIWHFGWNDPSPMDAYGRISAAGVRFFRVPPPSAHMIGPDNNDIEIATGKDRIFNHVHLQSEAPFCAGDWYEKVLGLTHPPDPGRVPGADCHVPFPPRSQTANQILNPNGRVIPGSGPFALSIYPNQRLHALTPDAADDRGPLVSPRGHVLDHIAFTVSDLPAALRRLRAAHVAVLDDLHRFGQSTMRAAMIEGPDKIAIELVEGMP
jgi:catechol 2,3-dioxygenase-like lactoylglutathione lyase family enzyme